MLKKHFLSNKCRVTFETTENIAQGVDNIHLVGDFNNWDTEATPMTRRKNHKFTVTLDLELDHEYQYRYLVNGQTWQNDRGADKYVPNPFEGDNSVVSTYQTETAKVLA